MPSILVKSANCFSLLWFSFAILAVGCVGSQSPSDHSRGWSQPQAPKSHETPGAAEKAAQMGEFDDLFNLLGPAAVPTSNLQYFGYPTGHLGEEYIPELENHTNMISVIYDPAKPAEEAELRTILTHANADFRIVIFVNEIFHTKDRRIYSDAEVTANLTKFKNLIGPYRQFVSYLAFDEPVWRQAFSECGVWNACTETVLRQGPPAQTVANTKRFLEQAGQQLRQMFPGIGLMDIEGGPMIRSLSPFPDNFDLYGFDCYTNVNDCYGRSITSIYQQMRSHVVALNMSLGGYRRLGVVAEAGLIYNRGVADPTVPQNAKDETEAIALFNFYDNLVQGDAMAILFAAWTWQPLQEGDVLFRGARSSTTLRERLESFGRSVTGKPKRPYVGLPVIDFLTTENTKVGERAFWSWSAIGADSCRSVTEPTVYPVIPPAGILVGPIESGPRSIDYTIACKNAAGEVQKSIRYVVTAVQPTSAVLNCTTTDRNLAAYSLTAYMKPESAHFTMAGRYFVAAFDPGSQTFFGFDGTQWSARSSPDAALPPIAGIETLSAEGLAVRPFNHQDLRAFPSGQIYVGYGLGSDNSAAWSEMLMSTRYRLCETLPAGP